MERPRVLVTGGAGFKGTVLVSRLLARGLPVTVLDNFSFGCDSLLHFVTDPNLTVVQRDVRDVEPGFFAGFDVIFHLAGVVGMPACAASPHVAESINVHATRRLVQALGNEQLLIYASTTSIYGASGDECSESVPPQPASVYGFTKLEAERLVQERDNSISLRFATVFGVSPRMRVSLLVNDFCYRAVNDRAIVVFAGHSRRTFVHIDDAIDGYLFALDHADAMRGQVFNVGHEALNFSKLDIARAIAAHVPFEIVDSSLPDLDVRNFLVSFARISRLGYGTKRTLDDGIRELLKLYAFYKTQSHPNLM